MVCLECNIWFQVIIGIVSSAVIAVIISYLFRHRWIPEPEKILNRNTKVTRRKMISHLDEVNYWKNRIFTVLGFNSVGGISEIHRPELEAGDVVSIHHNFRDELFYIDTQHSDIMIRLNKIDRDMDLICEKFNIS